MLIIVRAFRLTYRKAHYWGHYTPLHIFLPSPALTFLYGSGVREKYSFGTCDTAAFISPPPFDPLFPLAPISLSSYLAGHVLLQLQVRSGKEMRCSAILHYGKVQAVCLLSEHLCLPSLSHTQTTTPHIYTHGCHMLLTGS